MRSIIKFLACVALGIGMMAMLIGAAYQESVKLVPLSAAEVSR
jgi:hypothetical protein